MIAGTGALGDQLLGEAAQLPNLTVLRDVSSHDAQCLRAATAVGVFPTRVVPGFIETFCVAALEYQALGVPVLAAAIGGVPEAVPGDQALVEPGTTADGWWARIKAVLASRDTRAAMAAAHAAKFTSARSAQRLIDLAGSAAERACRTEPLKASAAGPYLDGWQASRAGSLSRSR